MIKRLIIFLLLVLLAGCSVRTGDVNGDGRISITDYTLIRLQINGVIEQDMSADVNFDGIVDTKDADIVKYIILR